jgi:hypothetical protein
MLALANGDGVKPAASKRVRKFSVRLKPAAAAAFWTETVCKSIRAANRRYVLNSTGRINISAPWVRCARP